MSLSSLKSYLASPKPPCHPGVQNIKYTCKNCLFLLIFNVFLLALLNISRWYINRPMVFLLHGRADLRDSLYIPRPSDLILSEPPLYSPGRCKNRCALPGGVQGYSFMPYRLIRAPPASLRATIFLALLAVTDIASWPREFNCWGKKG